jgi:flagellar biosynthetic protein FliP
MVAVMFIGMFALGMPADWTLHLFGLSTSGHHPALMLFEMGATMTVPMVVWMRYRGHSWRANLEMAGSMVAPTLAAVAMLWTGVATGVGMLMVVEHAAMLSCMLLAMLLRWEEYSGAGHAHGSVAPVAA